jgi:hypothetical protein
MRTSTTIRKARETWDAAGHTTNDPGVERGPHGKVVAVCAERALARVRGGAYRAARQLIEQCGTLGGIVPGYNDTHTLDEVKIAFDASYVVALQLEGRDPEAVLG